MAYRSCKSHIATFGRPCIDSGKARRIIKQRAKQRHVTWPRPPSWAYALPQPTAEPNAAAYFSCSSMDFVRPSLPPYHRKRHAPLRRRYYHMRSQHRRSGSIEYYPRFGNAHRGGFSTANPESLVRGNSELRVVSLHAFGREVLQARRHRLLCSTSFGDSWLVARSSWSRAKGPPEGLYFSRILTYHIDHEICHSGAKTTNSTPDSRLLDL
jgi:hypothetical protein